MSLLLDERCVVVQPSLVRALGSIDDAALLQQLHYWMQHATVEMGGFRWVYKAADEWSAEIGLSRHQVYRSIGRLVKLGVVVSCQPGGTDRRKWLRIDYAHRLFTERCASVTSISQNREMTGQSVEDETPILQNRKIEVAELRDATSDSAKCSSLIEDSLEDNTKASAVADAPADTAYAPEIEALCCLLADLIAANGSKRPTVTKRWREACRLMLERDGRTARQVENMIRWCQSNEFWRANILSMPKLREKYDQMRLQALASAKHADVTTAAREYLARKGITA